MEQEYPVALLEVLLTQDDWAEGLLTPLTAAPATLRELANRGWLETRPHGYRVTRAGKIKIGGVLCLPNTPRV